MCGDAVRGAISSVIKNPKYWLKGWPKMFYYTFIKGIDFVMGSEARFPENSSRRLVCLGNCSVKNGKEKGKEGVMLAGCPPTEEDVIRQLFS